MAYRLFDALKRAGTAFVGAPDPRETRIERRTRLGPSPQALSNQARRADQVRFREFRRTQGRPGIPGPFGMTSGAVAPIPPQIAAGRIASQLGTEIGPELNRLTAPDPMTFARGELAPEFAAQERDVGAAGVLSAEQMAEQERIRTGALGPQLQLDQDVAQAEEAQRAVLRPLEATQAGQTVTRGELDIADLERTSAGAPSPEEMLRDRETARQVSQTQAEQAANTQRLAAMESDIASLEAQGDFDGANQVRQQRDALLSGGVGPPAPGGAPPLSTGNINPVMLERRGTEAAAIAQATGLEGAMALLEAVAADRGAPNAGTAEKMESALATIEQALAMSPNEQARNILKAEIRNSEAYISVKQRAGLGNMALRSVAGAPMLPVHLARSAVGAVRPDKLRATQQMAARIVELVEG